MANAEHPPSGQQGQEDLEQALHALNVEEIAALWCALRSDPRQLLVCLDHLRRMTGPKAQAAACLLCFDLARRGDGRAEADFNSLIPVLQAFMPPHGVGAETMERLVRSNPFLQELWSDLQVRLKNRDSRLDPIPEDVDLEGVEDFLELPLLETEDLEDLDLDIDILTVDETMLRKQWSEAVDRIFPLVVSVGGFHPAIYPGAGHMDGGFRADTKEDLARVEKLREDALSLAEFVPDARAMLPLVELFLSAHTRAYNLFGRRNSARDSVLRAGLEHLMALKEPPGQAAVWLTGPTAAPYAWPKVAEILLDFISFLGAQVAHPQDRLGQASEQVDAYVRDDRPQPPPARLSTGPGSTERRRR